MKQALPNRGQVLGRLGLAVAVVGGLGLMSCYPGEVENLAELDTVATVYDKDYPFSQQSTFSLPDSVFHLCEILDEPPSDCIDLSRANDQLILATVRSNMEDLGYSEVPDDTTGTPPDVRVAVAAIGSKNTTWYVWYPWNPWYPGYGWGYPPQVGAVSYEAGTLFVVMSRTDQMIEDPGGEGAIPVVWNAALNGALGGSASSAAQRIEDGINQAYNQSPYLRTGGGN